MDEDEVMGGADQPAVDEQKGSLGVLGHGGAFVPPTSTSASAPVTPAMTAPPTSAVYSTQAPPSSSSGMGTGGGDATMAAEDEEMKMGDVPQGPSSGPMRPVSASSAPPSSTDDPNSVIHRKYELHRSFRDTLFGVVRFATHRSTKTPVVIKEYLKSLVAAKKTKDGYPVAEDAMKEIRMHKYITSTANCPAYIVKLLDLQQDQKKIYTVIEYCSNGDLWSWLKTAKRTEKMARVITKQLFTGLHFMHALNVCHRDLSLENLLVDAQQNVKICDFGVSIEAKPGFLFQTVDRSRRPGKIYYMAPEVFHCLPYDPRAADIWSCGVIIYSLFTGELPWSLPADTDPSFHFIYTQQNLALVFEKCKQSVPAGAVDLLQRIFRPQEERITMPEIVHHPWLN